MLKALLHSYIRGKLERPFGYDATYLHEIVDADPITFAKFGVVTGLTNHKAGPGEAITAAGLVGTLHEDCGPCTQIGVDMALAAGARPQVLRAILAGDEAAMGEKAALGYRFAKASLARDLDAADAARSEILRLWGRKALIAMAMSLTTARMYPTLKYALGHGVTCSKVVVAGVAAPFARPLPLVPLAA
ncbi:MAG TPA: hypothetical protein VGL58_20020 [Caulobacteraceae bacterium]|jgi:hypothetical protein